jgi:hypothetical protein
MINLLVSERKQGEHNIAILQGEPEIKLVIPSLSRLIEVFPNELKIGIAYYALIDFLSTYVLDDSRIIIMMLNYF